MKADQYIKLRADRKALYRGRNEASNNTRNFFTLSHCRFDQRTCVLCEDFI
uniref:Uncharacterized protein n=1 Tax=Anopheles atroparvus TaxID=41427 RepID=A0AAG5DL76_ANOAO